MGWCSLASFARKTSSCFLLLKARKRARRVLQMRSREDRVTLVARPPSTALMRKPAATTKISRITICFSQKE